MTQAEAIYESTLSQVLTDSAKKQVLKAMDEYAKLKWDEACEKQRRLCVSALPFPYKQLSYNSLHRLIDRAETPDFTP